MATKIVLDVLLFDGTRGLVGDQLSKSVYSHRLVLKLKFESRLMNNETMLMS